MANWDLNNGVGTILREVAGPDTAHVDVDANGLVAETTPLATDDVITQRGVADPTKTPISDLYKAHEHRKVVDTAGTTDVIDASSGDAVLPTADMTLTLGQLIIALGNLAISGGDVLVSNIGSLGLGTTVPSDVIHLRRADGTAIIRIELNDDTIGEGDVYGGVQWQGNDGSSQASGIRAQLMLLGVGVGGATKMVFRTASSNSTVLKDALTLLDSGKVELPFGMSGIFSVSDTTVNDAGRVEVANEDGIISSGDTIGAYLWRSNDLSTDLAGLVGKIEILAAADFTAGEAKTKINFHTNTGIAGTLDIGMTLDENGLSIFAGNIKLTNPSVPSTASSTGTAGEIAWDSDYFYVCVATDTWKRTALSSW